MPSAPIPKSKHELQCGRASAPIVVAATTREYRRTVLELVREDDVVLEIGCAHGVTCRLLAKYARRVVGVDCGEHEITAARARGSGKRENVDFVLAKFAADDGAAGALAGALAALGLTPQCVTLVYVDIAGTAAEAYVLPLVQRLQAECKPRATVVKNLRLRKLAVSFARGEALLAPEDPARAARVCAAARAREGAARRERSSRAVAKVAAAIALLGGLVARYPAGSRRRPHALDVALGVGVGVWLGSRCRQ